jgi:predicted RNA methylase
MASRFQVRGVYGVEVRIDVAELAQENLQVVKGRKALTVGVLVGDVTQVDLPPATVVFMFNPFGPITMAKCLERLHDSYIEQPRRIRIVYSNPQLADQLDRTSWLTRTDSFTILRHRTEVYEIAQ